MYEPRRYYTEKYQMLVPKLYEKVLIYDFIDKKLGKVAPYGVYDLTKKQRWG